jgi:polyhydroxyalkanoate synthase subunit PhaC
MTSTKLEDLLALEQAALIRHSATARTKLTNLVELLRQPGHHGTGASPHTVVHTDNHLRLLRLTDNEGRTSDGPPVIMVSAPVSRYFVLDLLPDRTYAGTLFNAGFDVYLVDFGEPDHIDRFADLDYYVVQLLARCVRHVRRTRQTPRVAIVGYCLGGLLSLLYTALWPETVSRLILLTTTVDGEVKGGIAWTAQLLGLPGESYESPRLVPVLEVKSWFEMLAPGSNSTAGRLADLWDRLEQPPNRLRDAQAMASWVDDVVPVPGRLLAELYREFGPGSNKLMRGTAHVGDRHVDLGRVTMPVLSVSAARDTIAPPEGVDAIAEVISHAEVIRLPGGHVGIVAGRTATDLWKRSIAFLQGGPSPQKSRASRPPAQ